jgi:hypothetical protein
MVICNYLEKDCVENSRTIMVLPRIDGTWSWTQVFFIDTGNMNGITPWSWNKHNITLERT